MVNGEKIIYSLSIEDVQTVAEEKFGRKLTVTELKTVEDKIGDHITWYEIIEYLILDELNLKYKD
ncbi:MAG: hypothetical protein ACYDFU_08190 [Nitrospirota bacterium]